MVTDNDPKRLSIRELANDFLLDFINSERGMGGTLLQLTVRPDLVIETYISGDRSRFVKPTRYLTFILGVAAAYFFAVQYWYDAPVSEMASSLVTADIEAQLDAQILADKASGILSTEEVIAREREKQLAVDLAGSMASSMLEYYSLLILASIPIVAFIFRAVFVLNAMTLAESLVASVYIGSHASFLYCLTFPLLLFGDSLEDFIFWTVIAQGLNIIYTCYALWRVYVHRWWELPLGIALFVLLGTLFNLSIWFIGHFVGHILKGDSAAANLPLTVATGLAAGACYYLMYHLYRLRFRDHRSPQSFVTAGVIITLIISVRLWV